ncbi:unnamed protein product [Trichogramma brassicae]|uniref:Beta-1,4-N-acetylgalactosaminyltransferase n=1 Tax=Trichogramma brassicae TaxID=86971 RepID=A0A6H5HXA1_9HYME|nr:unnamed protein product [Trichogramma brassicae]
MHMKARHYFTTGRIASIFLLIYSLLPSRFSPTHDFVRREDMISHLQFSESNNDSCEILVDNHSMMFRYADLGSIDAAEDSALRLGISPGGRWRPTRCRARVDVAIVVPYRGRARQLITFLAYMHPFLQSQQLDYQIIVVEQRPGGGGDFNRGKLFNVGFVELAGSNFSCFVFHDVDLLPQSRDNVYACGRRSPRHMSSAVNTFRYTLPWPESFGGVVALSGRQFRDVNGFANVYEGWGGEDSDMRDRVVSKGYEILRFERDISMYYMLAHEKEPPSPSRYERLAEAARRFSSDGLSNLEYRVLARESRPLYLWLLVDVR